MPKPTVQVTEFEEIDPEAVHLVGKGANGFPVLLAKAVRAEIDEVLEGGDDVQVPVTPVNEAQAATLAAERQQARLEEQLAASKADGGDDDGKVNCKTCNGDGKIMAGKRKCPDCNGAGKVGADTDAAEKKTFTAAERDKAASAGQAMPDGSYPIKTAADLDNAIHAVGRGGADHDAIRKHIISRAKALGLESKIPSNWGADGSMAGKALPLDLAGSASEATDSPVYPSPDLTSVGDAQSTVLTLTDSDGNEPGDKAWEAADSKAAADAATCLQQAAAIIGAFAERERTEYQQGIAEDAQDAADASGALQLVTTALGIMARLSFMEQASSDAATKAGRRLSSVSTAALAAARDALTDLLGEDDPGTKSNTSKDGDGDNADDGDDAAKQQGDCIDMEMTKEELAALIDERLEAADARKAQQAQTETDTAIKAEEERRAALSPEEIEAEDAAKAVADAEKQEQTSAIKAEVTALADEVSKEVAAVLTERLAVLPDIEERLIKVEQMAAPGGPVKTRTTTQIAKSDQRDQLELQADAAERRASDTADPELRKGYQEMAVDLRARAAAV